MSAIAQGTRRRASPISRAKAATGTPIVLLHGIGSNAQSFVPLMQAFEGASDACLGRAGLRRPRSRSRPSGRTPPTTRRRSTGCWLDLDISRCMLARTFARRADRGPVCAWCRPSAWRRCFWFRPRSAMAPTEAPPCRRRWRAGSRSSTGWAPSNSPPRGRRACSRDPAARPDVLQAVERAMAAVRRPGYDQAARLLAERPPAGRCGEDRRSDRGPGRVAGPHHAARQCAPGVRRAARHRQRHAYQRNPGCRSCGLPGAAGRGRTRHRRIRRRTRRQPMRDKSQAANVPRPTGTLYRAAGAARGAADPPRRRRQSGAQHERDREGAEDQPHHAAAPPAYARGRRLRRAAPERRRISGRPVVPGTGCARAVLAGSRAGGGAGPDQAGRDAAAFGPSRRARRHRRALSRAPHAEYAARQQHPGRQPAAGACHHHGPHDPRLHAADRDRAALCRQGAAAFQRAYRDHARGAARQGRAGSPAPASPGATPISSAASARRRCRCSISPARRSAPSTYRDRSTPSPAKERRAHDRRGAARAPAPRFPAVSAGSAPMPRASRKLVEAAMALCAEAGT